MRGKVECPSCLRFVMRITPAYAGKRRKNEAYIHEVEDHPRLCGEKVRVAAGVVAVSGSPPPMRGKVKDCVGGLEGTGITPAYAGKSC